MKLHLVLISLFFLFSILFTWCSIHKWEKITTSSDVWEKQFSIFEYKQECLKYKWEIENDLLTKQDSNINGEQYLLEQIFYSPIKQGCYFVSITRKNESYIRRLYEYGNHSYYSEAEYICNYYLENWVFKDNECDLEMNEIIKSLKW